MELFDQFRRPISLTSLGLKAVRLEVTPPEYETDPDDPAQRELLPRVLTAVFWKHRKIGQTLLAARNEAHQFFGRHPQLYVSDSPGALWPVYIDSMEMETVNATIYELQLHLIARDGVSESRNVFAAEIRGTGRVDVPGSWPVDPRKTDSLVLSYTGASDGLEVRNETNGTRWKVTGSTGAGDTVELVGVRRLLNGQTHPGQTNRELLTLEPGGNLLTVTGGTGALSLRYRAYNL